MDALLRRHGQALLALVGVALLGAAFVSDRDALSAALVVVGAGLLLFGVLADRFEGPVKLSPTGFEATLVAHVREQAQQRGLDAASTDVAVRRARDLAVARTSDEMAQQLVELMLGPERASIESISFDVDPASQSVSPLRVKRRRQ